MNFTPMSSRILVDDVPEKNDGLIKIPPTSKEKPTLMSVVVAIGKDVKDVAVGDTIYRGEWAGLMVSIDGRLYRIMNIMDVLGKVE